MLNNNNDAQTSLANLHHIWQTLSQKLNLRMVIFIIVAVLFFALLIALPNTAVAAGGCSAPDGICTASIGLYVS